MTKYSFVPLTGVFSDDTWSELATRTSDRSPQLCTSASFPREINEEWGWSLSAAHLLSKDEHFHLEEKAQQNLKNIQITTMCQI